MPPDMEQAPERTPLLSPFGMDGQLSHIQQDEEASSIVLSHIGKTEQAMGGSSVGERLPYNDYTTIDWLHDLVKDSYRYRLIQSRKGLRYLLLSNLDACCGWIAVAIIGTLTACVAFVVDVAEATVSDWKFGYCRGKPFLDREGCCKGKTPLLGINTQSENGCNDFVWSESYWGKFGIYVGFALAFGVISATATTFSKRSMPAVAQDHGDKKDAASAQSQIPATAASGKSIYMAAGSGIPEIKTILVWVLLIKAFGVVFAVATGMCLGKEGPFVHISTCVGYLVGMWFPKYRSNGRKMRELLSAACASGLSVAFGAPIGGVLFSYEEISTYFPRKVLWKAFLCSLFAAMVLKALNPTGIGNVVLFETHYGTSYQPQHYVVFILLGVAGGLFGGVFCKANFIWSKWFRNFYYIKTYPVFEVFLVVLATALVQYPNSLIREPGDFVLKSILVDCRSAASSSSWVCRNEARTDGRWEYVGRLVYGTTAKLVLTIGTFGCKIPSGVIIPAVDAGALFGRLVGQWIGTISPGIFAMVGAAAFLAGVSRMTISLCVIMFELTGELEYIVPHMIAILVAKWTADAISKEGVYDLAQTVLGHPFLEADHALALVRAKAHLVERLIPPKHTMAAITVHVPKSNKVPRKTLHEKLEQLKARGLMDAGLVLVQDGILQGYIAEGELDFGLNGELGVLFPHDCNVRLLGDAHEEGEFDLSMFVDRTPLTICAKAPMEYLVEMFGKLGLRYVCVTEEGTGRLVGVVIKKRLLSYLEELDH